MSDPAPVLGTRTANGTVSDRKFSTAQAAASGAGAALCIGFSDWFFQCAQGNHWVWIVPNQQLIEMGAPILLLPVALWIARVFTLIGTIITNRLQKDADKA